MTYKKLVEAIGNATTKSDFAQIRADLQTSYEIEEKITYKDYQTLYDIAERLSWAVE